MTTRPPVTFSIHANAPLQSCRSCSASIYWIVTGNNRKMPVDPSGVSHFATCPNAAEHRKPR
jgi:hypothetical protein